MFSEFVSWALEKNIDFEEQKNQIIDYVTIDFSPYMYVEIKMAMKRRETAAPYL